MEKRIFGFDIGIASLGWAVVDFDDTAEPENNIYPTGKIVKSGVRCFPVAENPKDGSSLAFPRRQKRSQRKLCRRKARRMAGIKSLFVANGLIDRASLFDEKENIYKARGKADVWDLRVKALTEKLTTVEFIRVLTHLAKHRGFKSYRIASEKADKENGKVLEAVKANRALLENGKTLAQIIVEKGGKKRNRDDREGKSTYENSIPRDEIERETKLIFEKQRTLGLAAATEKLQRDFEGIAFRFREINGKNIEKMIGKCLFEKDEPRAPKNAPSAEFFVAWTKINNCRIRDKDDKLHFLTQEEKNTVFELLKSKKEVKYADIRKKLFPNRLDTQFAEVEYTPKPVYDKKTGEIKQPENPENLKFFSLKGWHDLKSVIDVSSYSVANLDKAVAVIATQKNDADISKELKKLDFSDSDAEKLAGLSFSKFISLSLKALYNILPEMQTGKKYNEACEAVGYDFKSTGGSFAAQKGKFLPPIPESLATTVPVVNRAMAQFRKVYNALVREYGTPDQINVELARDVYNNHDERREIADRQNEYAEAKKKAKASACSKLELADISGRDLLKFLLYEQQDGKCVYSGEKLDLHRLVEQDYCDVDHIIPYSRSLDNSQNNKVLCLSRENRQKADKTPLEYITDPVKQAEFIARVKAMKGLGSKKRDRLLLRDFNEKDVDFRERNINDTRYMARYIMKYLDDCIDFSQSKADVKDRVQARNGALTDFLRHQWGLKKNRSESDKHHAQDAIVIACATNGYTQYLAHLSKIFENKQAYANKYGEPWYKAFKQHVKQPWDGFYQDVQASLAEIFVSRPPRKNATGEIHQDTVHTLNPKKKNRWGELVYSAKDVKSGLNVRGGMAGNSNMFRCDVFEKGGRFFIVPVYLADFCEKNRSDCFCPKDKEHEKPDETYNFLFSVFKDDYLSIETNKGEKFYGYMNQYITSTGQFYIGSNDSSPMYSISTSSFEKQDILLYRIGEKFEKCSVVDFDSEKQEMKVASLEDGSIHKIKASAKVNKKGEVQKIYKTDKPYEKLDKGKTISSATFKRIRKYQVDPLGRYVEVKSEIRLPLNIKKGKA